MPSKKDAAYWREYRAKKGQEPSQEPSPDRPKTDREAGLPRSNYYSDWTSTIQSMDQKRIDVILSHPAIKTPKRSQ